MKDTPLNDSINYVFYKIGEDKAETLDAVWANPVGATPVSFAQPDIEKITQYLLQGDEKNDGVVDLATLKNKIISVMLEDNGKREWVAQLLVEENMKSSMMFEHTNEYCDDPT